MLFIIKTVERSPVTLTFLTKERNNENMECGANYCNFQGKQFLSPLCQWPLGSLRIVIIYLSTKLLFLLSVSKEKRDCSWFNLSAVYPKYEQPYLVALLTLSEDKVQNFVAEGKKNLL